MFCDLAKGTSLLILAVLMGAAFSACSPQNSVNGGQTGDGSEALSQEQAKKILKDRGIFPSHKNFYKHVVKGDFEAVDLFLAAGMDINGRDEFGGTVLYGAMFPSGLKMAKHLIDKGADVNLVADIGTSPLHAAVEQQAVPTVRLLLEHGADPNQAELGDSRPGYTPLMSAARVGNVELVKLLLDHGAQVHTASGSGYYAEGIAREKGHEVVVQMLQQAGT